MKIKNILTDYYKIPLPTVMTDSTHGVMRFFELITVRVQDNNGNEGLGYTYTVGVGGNAIRNLIETDIKPILINENCELIENLWKKMWWHLHYVGRGGLPVLAISAIDIGLWDLKCKSMKTPLWIALGGHCAEVKAYAGGIDLQLSLDELLLQTQKNIKNGFKAIKMKVGRELLSEDYERVSEVRNLLGDDYHLMIDANMGWSVEKAIKASKTFENLNIYWLEEPTIPEDILGYSRIQNEGNLPIAAGENFKSIYEFKNLINQGGVTFPEPDVSNCGGITTWMKIAALAEANNLEITSHGVHDLHVHLLASIPNSSYLEIHGFGLDNFIKNPLKIQNGIARAPNSYGHGIEFNWNELNSI